ncbi:LLM class flavin-dependent oxidoreductase [Microbacterium sp. NIBRBAC000506063]|nr:LLM class flavin-dependent oxidoreductase [Microbacterium sp. NIBRBAC000506063]
MLAAAAAQTSRITLSSAMTVLSTDDPVRVYEQYATVDAISNGRVEMIPERGSSIESYPLFGYDLKDYDRLFTEKLDLLLKVNRSEHVKWTGTTRPALDGEYVPPRAEHGPIPIWLGAAATHLRGPGRPIGTSDGDRCPRRQRDPLSCERRALPTRRRAVRQLTAADPRDARVARIPDVGRAEGT